VKKAERVKRENTTSVEHHSGTRASISEAEDVSVSREFRGKKIETGDGGLPEQPG